MLMKLVGFGRRSHLNRARPRAKYCEYILKNGQTSGNERVIANVK